MACVGSLAGLSRLQDHLHKVTEEAQRMPTSIRSWLRFGFFSGLSFFVVLGVTVGLTELLGVRAEVSFVAAVVVAFFMNFVACRYFIFEAAAGNLWRQLSAFFLGVIVFRLAEYIGFLVIHSLLEVDYRIATVGILLG